MASRSTSKTVRGVPKPAKPAEPVIPPNPALVMSDAELDAKLKGLKDEAKVFEAEYNRREEERRRKDEERRAEALEAFVRLLKANPILVNALTPVHTCNNCSDDNYFNGFGSNGPLSRPRCNRCALIQIAAGDTDYGDLHGLCINFEIV